MGDTGRRWSFLLAFEEVQDERGLRTASSGHIEDTHSTIANSSRTCILKALLTEEVGTHSNIIKALTG